MADADSSRPRAGVRGFFTGAAKLGVGLFVAALALAAAGGAAYWAKLEYDRREAAPYEEPKRWTSDLTTSIGTKVVVRT